MLRMSVFIVCLIAGHPYTPVLPRSVFQHPPRSSTTEGAPSTSTVLSRRGCKTLGCVIRCRSNYCNRITSRDFSTERMVVDSRGSEVHGAVMCVCPADLNRAPPMSFRPMYVDRVVARRRRRRPERLIVLSYRSRL